MKKITELKLMFWLGWLCLICAVLLLLAIPKLLPGAGFNIFLRCIILITCLLLRRCNSDDINRNMRNLFLVIAVIYFPFVPIWLPRSISVPIDLIVAIIFYWTSRNFVYYGDLIRRLNEQE